jgi:hypothetical protein
MSILAASVIVLVLVVYLTSSSSQSYSKILGNNSYLFLISLLSFFLFSKKIR